MLKRIFDIIIATCGLIILSPLFFIIALLIKLDSKGPVLYRGIRVGLMGNLFTIYKFRTMVYNAERIGPFSTSKNDSRLTKVGAKIRKYKIDETSQLINVLIGDMSLVGPRPEVRKYVEMYTEEEKIILSVRPGITDYASLKFYNEGEIIAKSGIEDADEAYTQLIRPEKIRLQLKYLKERSLLLDIKLILLTLLRVIRKNNGIN